MPAAASSCKGMVKLEGRFHRLYPFSWLTPFSCLVSGSPHCYRLWFLWRDVVADLFKIEGRVLLERAREWRAAVTRVGLAMAGVSLATLALNDWSRNAGLQHVPDRVGDICERSHPLPILAAISLRGADLARSRRDQQYDAPLSASPVLSRSLRRRMRASPFRSRVAVVPSVMTPADPAAPDDTHDAGGGAAASADHFRLHVLCLLGFPAERSRRMRRSQKKSPASKKATCAGDSMRKTKSSPA